jgi:hypothetical protein
MKKFYVEPQVGAGIFSKKIYTDRVGIDPDGRLNDGAIFYGIEGGYHIGKRVQSFIKFHRLNTISTFSEAPSGLSNDKTLRYGGIGISFKLD